MRCSSTFAIFAATAIAFPGAEAFVAPSKSASFLGGSTRSIANVAGPSSSLSKYYHGIHPLS
jgi:hypothetical protein